MGNRKLPSGTGNRLLDAINRAEEAVDCRVGFGPYGICMNSHLPKWIHLGISVDPRIHYESDIPDPSSVDSFTVRFAAYTTEDGITVNFLTAEDIETMLPSECLETQGVAAALKELVGIKLELDRTEYMEAEDAVFEREKLEFEDICRLDEEEAEQVHGMSSQPGM